MEIPKGGSDENNKAGQKKHKVVYAAKKKKTPPVTAMPQIDASVGEEEKILKPSVDQQHVQHLAEDNGNALGNDDKVVSSSTVDDDLERAVNGVDIDIVDDWESADVGELVRFFLLMAKLFAQIFFFLTWIL